MKQNRNAASACLLALIVLYVVLEIVPGRFAAADDVFFKAAGRNWAMTGRFAAPEIVGFLSDGPPLTEVYFAQPPLYSFLYGVYVKLVGFDPRSCMFYDVLIHLLLVWTFVAVARTVYGMSWRLSALCGALVIPLGTVARPDELGVVFALCGAVVFRSRLPRATSALVGGVLLGLCGATSLGALVFLGPLVAWELRGRGQAWAETARKLGLAAFGGLAAAAACVAPILVRHPAAYQQLIVHSGEYAVPVAIVTGGRARNLASHLLQTWAWALRTEPSLTSLIAGLLMFALFCWWLDESADRSKYARIILAVVSLVLLIAALPSKPTYFLFPGSWLFLACAAAGAEVARSTSRTPRRVLLAVAGVAWLISSFAYLRWKIILWTLPADQSLTVNCRRVRSEIPAGVGVLGSDYWWALADRDRVYDGGFGSPEVSAVDYIVLSGNGTGTPGKPQELRPPYQNAGFRLLDNHLNPRPASFLGFRFSRSAYGFGVYVMAKSTDTRRQQWQH